MEKTRGGIQAAKIHRKKVFFLLRGVGFSVMLGCQTFTALQDF